MSPDTGRADRRRNRERLVTAAIEVFARDGAAAPLEEIARSAGVGSATLHRHFGSRRELLEAVCTDGVEQLCLRADELVAGEGDPGAALWVWLDELVRYAAATRGVVGVLLTEPEVPACHSNRLRDALEPLRAGAIGAAAVHPEAGVDDLLALVTGISRVTDDDPEAASRLLELVRAGVGSHSVETATKG
ncbi:MULTISPECIES: TetR/AcrR family transcriptional regulator [Pseudonocardia]|uniref:HTH-type transcriptional regulator BetI n=2 Tax=Pseudonocardia TaxID=1847 RepID=A0A1Y2N8A1_PSEAH|nr:MULTISPECIES: TetR/AcrR family transcriptional regulator [Pseudonocardia]OSY43673.1 HTH-type transcriptional regulator BetI [Pseudonocardia autotrophica]TDN73337.1 TetR family transcriptional regulator [Pseudonocardia autotrophica]BBG04075.1 TetR family transcriptional regulator [Pseudonocardia autotrophica]GEC26212.1 TetR family transcriptional regulator [Pseudonocardia saturnea]